MNDLTLHYLYDPLCGWSAALVEAMKRRYPNLPGEEGLELSAKVLKGEMQWP